MEKMDCESVLGHMNYGSTSTPMEYEYLYLWKIIMSLWLRKRMNLHLGKYIMSVINNMETFASDRITLF
jgi:hypothetical protein